MKYTRLGNTGLIVSRLAFGAMTFGTDAGAKLSQLEDNLAALNVELTAEELRELDAATAPVPLYPNWFQARTLDAPAAAALGAASSGR